jgi:hypothetical protein
MSVPKLFLASAFSLTAIAAIGAPTISQGIECLQMCKDFQPQHGVTDDSGYGCQDMINDSGGFCTLDGKLNTALDMPKPRILYNKRSATGHEQIYVDSLRQTIIR